MMMAVTPTRTATIAATCLMAACASDPGERGPRQSQLRDCPPGQVLICESRERPSKAGQEEIPVYEFCYCENVM